MASAKTLREGATPKRAAIVTAARELFFSDGFDRTSVDAVAARAGVSKRTVYDYFGDKVTLLNAVVDTVGQSMVATIRRTLDETLAEVDAAGLEDALVAFSMRVSTDMLGSPEYATLQRLAQTDSGHLAKLDRYEIDNAPEEALAERFAALTEAGLLDVTDPRLGADQFIALTFGVALNRLRSANAAEDPRVRPILVEGVRVFLRAYRSGP
ncbi:TetR/AcrR family transcriptional regulator [Plantactinospora mayteni]|uniref:TetR family transcriptional regulator n=1 Tax=Plantactinospora mayteni TaxID=566021 RepID=A0ABQ4EHL0_9ACTN|nr:TetR/AcrR family transcriptional regulator [Plantactinospora mayteni]GIG94206.1 TetR family transcriptional regulator [Plantactinospora mayteni]